MNFLEQRLLAAKQWMGDKLAGYQQNQARKNVEPFFNSLQSKPFAPKPMEQVRSEYRDTIKRMVPTQNAPKISIQRQQAAQAPQYQDSIRKTFGDQSRIAQAILQAESQGDFSRIGDRHLMFKDSGEDLGDSVGGFQIRTGGNEGGKVWNRAKANGMTAEQFRQKMLIPEENIKYAKSIYDRFGWAPWSTYTQGTYKNYLK